MLSGIAFRTFGLASSVLGCVTLLVVEKRWDVVNTVLYTGRGVGMRPN